MEYAYLIIGSLVVGFVVGFFVGGKHKERVMRGVDAIRETGRKL